MMILVSACLAGLDVKHNGSHNLNEKKKWLMKKGYPDLPAFEASRFQGATIVGGEGEDVLDGHAKGSQITE
jgi:hypothetical protein